MMTCRICGDGNTVPFSIKTRKYDLCRTCGSICTDTESIAQKDEQKERYLQHHNALADEGYKSFLEGFINPILDELTGTEKITRILDYGSGPEPALCQLLKVFAEEGRYLQADTEIRGWDPFFAPDTAFFEAGADLVTCLEVAEHFEKPLEDMQKLSSAVRSGGYAAIGTMLLQAEEGAAEEVVQAAFSRWWYRSDVTHVAFYTIKGLISCASQAGLEFVKAVSDRAFLFRKRA